MTLIPIIISGGSGSRLWPVSRKAHPKPFIRLPDGKSLLQHTFLRAAALQDVSGIVTVTNQDLQFGTADEYREVNPGPSMTMLLEPAGRDTAAAVAAATLHVAATHGGDAILFVMPADHIIRDLDAFGRAASRAVALAGQGRLVTLGIKPTHAETAYGYIEADGEDVVRFVEKPSREKAEEYLRTGRFHWNGGMLCFRADTMLALLEKHCADILDATRASLETATKLDGAGGEALAFEAQAFARIPALSIDYALLEKAGGIAVVPSDMGWSDVGSWNAIAELTDADEAGNRVQGDAVLVGTRDTYVHGEKRLVAGVGLKDLVIVDSADALLVAAKDSLQDVKILFEELKSQGHEAHQFHRTVHRPWGSYTVLEEGERFKIKRIEVKPGASLSLQMHHHRSEHWVVVTGRAKVVNGDRELILETNQSTYIEKEHKHRLENPTNDPLVMIEVQSGDYLGEDDIVRFDDIYGRS
ncbi:mannose-1-phosphate guanylyltransferase/mannose-6-phosphate isomerase [Mesorhizobium sp. CAU 1741]|uniref:mannose-1-phosphate guanylyltransferase/mannose-6-phosphate isomerase n=1 Tax=Mesorhizobium sp. CAU 1741 TaxID=3140366 RepID=UPI00325BF210